MFLFLEGLSFMELAIILLIAVLIFGPNKLPEIARGLGQGVRKMKEATEDIKREIINQTEQNNSINEIKKEVEEAKNEIKEIEGTIKR